MPVALITGDKKLIEEAETLLGKVEKAIVKETVGSSAAHALAQLKLGR